MSDPDFQVIIQTQPVAATVTGDCIMASLQSDVVHNAMIGTPGPRGPQGPMGERGATGETGAQGPAGAPGLDGADGATGPTGPAGAQGTVGPTGPMGAAGPQGIPGDVVSTGPITAGNLTRFFDDTGAVVEDAGLASDALVRATASTVTVNVPADMPTVQEALDALLAYRFQGTAQGVVSISSGTYAMSAPLRCRHPQPGSITLKASQLSTAVTLSDFTGVKADDEAMIRAKHAVVFECAHHGLEFEAGEGLGSVESIAFMGQTNRIGVYGPYGGNGTGFSKCSFFGFRHGLYMIGSSDVVGTQLVTAHCTDNGTFISSNATATFDQMVSVHNRTGLAASLAATAKLSNSTASYNSNGNGLQVADGGRITLSNGTVTHNTYYGASARYGGQLNLLTCDMSNNTSYAVSASIGCNVRGYKLTVSGSSTQRTVYGSAMTILSDSGGHTGGVIFSPAKSQEGNANSYTS